MRGSALILSFNGSASSIHALPAGTRKAINAWFRPKAGLNSSQPGLLEGQIPVRPRRWGHSQEDQEKRRFRGLAGRALASSGRVGFGPVGSVRAQDLREALRGRKSWQSRPPAEEEDADPKNPSRRLSAGARFFPSLPGTQGLPEIFRAE